MTVLLEYLHKVLYVNQWDSVIQTNSLIWTLLPNFRNKGVRIMENPLYITGQISSVNFQILKDEVSTFKTYIDSWFFHNLCQNHVVNFSFCKNLQFSICQFVNFYLSNFSVVIYEISGCYLPLNVELCNKAFLGIILQVPSKVM